MKFLLKTVLSAAAVAFLAWLLPGVDVQEGFMYALLIAAVIGVLNAVVRPILVFFTLPATLVTLGLFLLVINACIILIADRMLDSFSVDGFWWALLFSILLTFINTFISDALKKEERKKTLKKEKVIIIDKEGNKIG